MPTASVKSGVRLRVFFAAAPESAASAAAEVNAGFAGAVCIRIIADPWAR